MSHTPALGAIEWEAESTFNENVSTFATGRVGIINAVDLSQLTQEKIVPGRTVQYRGEGSAYINGLKGGSIVTDMWLTGHESTTAGNTSLTTTETLLGRVFGNAAEAAAAGGTTATGGTATVVTTTASGTFDASGAVRIGALGDGDGEGQFYAISTHSVQNMTVLNDLAGAPVNGAIIYAPTLIYEPSAPTTSSIGGTRFRAITANLAYELHGCHATSVTLSGFNVGEPPKASITWDVGEHFPVGSVTFPSAVTAVTANPAACCAGTLHIQDVGTTTRNVVDIVDLQITYNLQTQRVDGYGSPWQYSGKRAAFRTHDNNTPPVTISFKLAADAQTATPTFGAAWLTTTPKIMVITCSIADGSAIGFVFRRCFWTGPLPTQEDFNGRNTRTYTLCAHVDTTSTATDRSRAPMLYLSA